MFSYFCHLGRHPGVEFPFPAIRLTNIELSMARKNMETAQKEQEDKEDEGTQRTNGIILMNSSREIEGKYMDYLSVLINRTIIPVGALVQDSSVVPDHDDDDEIMAWLDEKYELSSVFVSFGSEYFLKKDEIEEIAYGLELSKVNFIWIIRFPKGEEMKLAEVLPKGYLDRIGNRGKVVIKWAPQGKILMHSSIGAFVSHCGWNSLMESIEFGVPIVAMPMHLDQPMNAKLVVEIGVGVEVRRYEEGKIEREEICKVIKDVVFGESGQVLRKRVGEMREIIRFRSREEIEEVVEKLVEVCGKSFDAKSYNHGRNEEESI
ncbi:hypothetical protein RD792_013465 [Penstemon davidsonii]|uniref:UDP-glycosyltransferases domain-containing protein n=1 Tax=Penstemon davidsonii TaxID=160366 RepID=A0ABR0CTK5_9LAMI|nr:hypothetical protein RD792_013465 [Penstemon davidsonii]